MYSYEWTDEYGIFRLVAHTQVHKEIRPVFHEELDFFGMDAFWDYPKNTDAPLLWAEGFRRYVLNGECIAEARGGDFYTKPTVERLTTERLNLQPIDVERLYEINHTMMLSLTQKAIEFIQTQYAKYAPLGYTMVCAFSGGKDSLVLLDLMEKALAPDVFYVVFSNTGMELSDTLKAVERAKARWPKLRFIEAKCHMEPAETWDLFGPPGRRKRWCCSVHKSVPTLLKLREITGDYNARAIVFDGVRAEESVKRSQYEDVSINAKNISQTNCHAILNWNAAEVYCYLLAHNLFLNDVYRLGLHRVGCMVCPMSSEWWEGIVNTVYADEIAFLVEQVEKYAKNAKGDEAKKFIQNGGWKARVGGKGLPNGGNRVHETIDGDWLTFTITEPTQDWMNVAPLLGVFVETSNDLFVHKIDGIAYECQIQHQNNKEIISYRPFSKMNRFAISHFRGIANKTAYCVGCKACEVQCPTGAFSITEKREIMIREKLCIHCYNCLTFTDRSCLVAENMRIPEGGFVNMKGLDPYHHFGLRQDWIEHFFDEGVNCFNKEVLGKIQYTALKVWLKEAELVRMVKNGNTSQLSITPLGEKMIATTAYNPFTWAVMWANICCNSTICHWYCLNVKAGTTYEKADLVIMLGESLSKSNRENAITALTDLMRNSPIGTTLKQGIPLNEGKNKYTYYREGWQFPDGVAVLYALYLYAEHTGRRALTFRELLDAHKNPDNQGVSPHDIYGIAPNKFREILQGLAISFPNYLRISFQNNLDNIMLENVPSLEILLLKED